MFDLSGFAKTHTQKLALSGVIAALTVLVTMLSIPISIGYIHLGDAAVFLGVYVLGGVWGVFAGAVGSAIADLVLGYALYIPATLVIKSVMALLAVVFMARFPRKLRWLAFVLAALVVPIGYFAYETLLYGAQTALLTVPFNLIQAVLSAFCAYLITISLDKLHR